MSTITAVKPHLKRSANGRACDVRKADAESKIEFNEAQEYLWCPQFSLEPKAWKVLELCWFFVQLELKIKKEEKRQGNISLSLFLNIYSEQFDPAFHGKEVPEP